MKKNKLQNILDVEKVVQEFEKEEALPVTRKGTFKINRPFDEALDTILKAKQGQNKPKKKR